MTLLRDGLWTEVTRSEHPHEREGLDYVRGRLPDREPYRAWSNFTFVALDGKLYEVDLLVVSPGGVYLIELKAWPGKLDGDVAQWTWTSPDGRRRTVDNPRFLADTKAKKLKSLLLAQPAFRRERFSPYIDALVFLHAPKVTSLLDERARANVLGRDPEEGEKVPAHRLPGLIAHLTRVDPRAGAPIDRRDSQILAQAIQQAGIRPTVRRNRVGPYELKELLAEAEHWQDWRAEHLVAGRTSRRLRLFLMGKAQSKEERLSLERAARREFELLQGIEHPGIERPADLLPSERGPAQVFDYDPEARRLDHWLAEHRDDLDLLDRIDLVRSLAEALRFAHQEGLAHRALTPERISVSTRDGKPQLRIGDWQTIARATRHTTTTAAGTHLGLFVTDEAARYLPPELLQVPDVDPRRVDIFSLGALAVLLLSGEPPAPDLDGLHQLLRHQGCLTLSAVADAADTNLDLAIQAATHSAPASRLLSVDDFLEFLDLAVEELTAPEVTDPIDAKAGDEIAGLWKVTRRFGSGSTSVVLLTEREGRREVLKVARDDAAAARLRDEHAVLVTLEDWRDYRIVRTFGLEEVAGRTVLRLEAASETLAHRLERDGPVSLDLLERFGTDLLEALVVLERAGINHRDIKPDNIGIIPRGRNDERHLVLFDFSLARADPKDLRAGTLGYVDPFLSERKAARWDLHAERYAAAVVLHEMASGTRPQWGDGQTAPDLTDEQVPHVAADLVDASVREPLAAFLRKALHRRPGERFETAQAMLEAFRAAIAGIDTTSAVQPAPVDVDEVDLSAATAATPVRELGLSARHRSVLDRLRVDTLEDLAAVPAAELSSLAGVGAAVRRDVARLAQRVREQLETGPAPAPAITGTPASVDRLADLLLPKPPADDEQRRITAAFLGLDDRADAERWPSQRGVAERLGLPLAAIIEMLGNKVRPRWRRRPELTEVRGELVEALRARHGIAGGDELAAVLLTNRGSQAIEPFRTQRARAVVRAAVEAETTLDAPRLRPHRLGEGYLVALSGPVTVEDETEWWHAEAAIDAAAALGDEADRLAVRVPLASFEEAVAALRQVPVPEGAPDLPDPRLVRVAAAASTVAAVSSRLELYPRGMTARRAIEEARPALLDPRGLTVEELRRRVRARFPDAEPLPGRPALDALLAEAGAGLVWQPGRDGEAGRFCLEDRGGVLSTRSSSSLSASTYSDPEERDAAVRDLDDRLARLRRDGGFVALTVDPRRLRDAADVLGRHLDAAVVDVDATLVAAMRRHAEAARADWERILQADAADPHGREWGILQRLVRRAVPDVEEALLHAGKRVVATGLGLLARYDRLDVFARLLERVTRRRGDEPLDALVVLTPGGDPTARPQVDGRGLPVATPNQWAHLPTAWLLEHGKVTA